MKYTFGDQVIVKKVDEKEIISANEGTVVGITQVKTEELSKDLGAPIGATLYTIEFGDGSDILVEEKMLKSNK